MMIQVVEGFRVGRLVVVCETTAVVRSLKRIRRVLVRCDCGHEKELDFRDVRRGHVKSCGCLRRDTSKAMATKHSMAGTSTYSSWSNMVTRCTNPKHNRSKKYQGIGIAPSWLNFEGFLRDMGEKPSSRYSIERVDNSKGYYPWNCRWASSVEQQRNKSTNRFICAFGETKTAVEWQEVTGVKSATIRKRLKLGWSAEAAVSKQKSPDTCKQGRATGG